MSQPAACDLSRVAALNILIARTRLGWSQRRLGEEAGISAATVAAIEVCTRNLTLPVMERVAEVLGVEPADLLRAAGESAATGEAA